MKRNGGRRRDKEGETNTRGKKRKNEWRHFKKHILRKPQNK